jgi:2-amino-4-hydroxy-6-hydroxymethyldihydropteridine diphosphokinase
MSARTYIALGSNLGDRVNHLQKALFELDQHQAISITKVSSIYETDPVGILEQQQFLNMAAEMTTTLMPLELLQEMHKIEMKHGRVRTIRWGPRTIDLDILLYNQLRINTEALQIPHPRMIERGFVLIPLYELNPDVHIPGCDETLAAIIRKIPDKEGVRLWKQNCGEGKFGLFVS